MGASESDLTDFRHLWRKRQHTGASWLGFLNSYRTMCLAPTPEFRRVLEEIQGLPLAA